jgi:hypothetical protein
MNERGLQRGPRVRAEQDGFEAPPNRPNRLLGLAKLNDEQLENGLRRLLSTSARLEVRIALYLVEVEARRLHLRAGYSSLYEYCRDRLGLSEFEAYLRICAARVGKKFPVVFELLGARAIHLTTIHLLRDYLTSENHRALLEEASHKTKRQVTELLAARFPRADIATSLRKLPSLEPLSPGRYRLELTVSADLKQKLELACDLLSHVNPNRDLGVVIDRALEELLTQLDRRRFAQRKAVKKSAAPSPPQASAIADPSATANASLTPSPSSPSPSPSPSSAPQASSPAASAKIAARDVPQSKPRRHIARAVRRDVATRDQRRCTFTSDDGRRCNARAFLQLHHERAFAHGGADSRDNLRWLCAAHNRLLAERDFGIVHVRNAIAQRRATAAPAQRRSDSLDGGAPRPADTSCED